MMWGEMKCCRFLWAVEELISLRPAPSREGGWCATDVRAGAQRDPALACLRKEREVPVNKSSWTDSPAVRWVLGGRGIPWDLRLPSGQTCPAVPSVQPLRPSPVGWSGLVNAQVFILIPLSQVWLTLWGEVCPCTRVRGQSPLAVLCKDHFN